MYEIILYYIKRYHLLKIIKIFVEKALSGRRALFNYAKAKYREEIEEIQSSIIY